MQLLELKEKILQIYFKLKAFNNFRIMEKTQKEYSIQEIGEYIIEIKKYYGPTSQEYTEAYNTWKSIMRIIELKENIK